MCDAKNRNTGSGSCICRKQTYSAREYDKYRKKLFFARLLIAKGEKDTTKKIVSFMYKDNMQIRRKGDLFAFYKVNLPLLWFLNITSCYR